jgi:hypothetical protein
VDYILDETRLGLLVDDWTSRWPALGESGLLLGIGVATLSALLLSVVAWAKGRKVVAVLMWLCLVLLGLLASLPTSATDNLSLEWSAVGVGLLVALAVLLVVGVFVAARLATPSSWWAQRRYESEKYDRSVERHGWSRIRAR